MLGKLQKDDAAEIFREPILYREWARRFTTVQKFIPATVYFRKAMKAFDQVDLRTLLGICKSQAYFVKYMSAERTSRECESIDPRNYDVQQMRVETLYLIGEFCYSLMKAYNGRLHRKMAFELDIYRGRETIESSVGADTVPDALQRLVPWIKRLEEHRKVLFERLMMEQDEFEGIDKEVSKFKVNDPVAQEEEAMRKMQRAIARIYLGRLFDDMAFRERTLSNADALNCPNEESTKLLHYHLKRSIRKGKYRQDIVRMNRPLYVTLFEKTLIPLGHKAMIEHEKQLKRNNIVVRADFLLRSLHDARMRRDYVTFFRYVNRIKDTFDAYSLNMFPLKQKCLNALYKMIAWAYIDTRNLMRLPNEKMKKRYLKHHLRIIVGHLPRCPEIGWVTITTRKETVSTFRRRLALATESLELAWLFHDFCKFLIETRRYEVARYYGKKSRDMALQAKSDQWALNASHLMILVEIAQNNRNEAKEAALAALASSRKLGIDYLLDFYTRTMRIIDEIDIEKTFGSDGIATRQKTILALMPETLKTEVDFLLRSMEAVPAKRRLSIMPGCKPVDRKFKLPCKRKTILPSPPREPDKVARRALLKQYAPSTERAGYVNFQQYD